MWAIDIFSRSGCCFECFLEILLEKCQTMVRKRPCPHFFAFAKAGSVRLCMFFLNLYLLSLESVTYTWLEGKLLLGR